MDDDDDIFNEFEKELLGETAPKVTTPAAAAPSPVVASVRTDALTPPASFGTPAAVETPVATSASAAAPAACTAAPAAPALAPAVAPAAETPLVAAPEALEAPSAAAAASSAPALAAPVSAPPNAEAPALVATIAAAFEPPSRVSAPTPVAAHARAWEPSVDDFDDLLYDHRVLVAAEKEKSQMTKADTSRLEDAGDSLASSAKMPVSSMKGPPAVATFTLDHDDEDAHFEMPPRSPAGEQVEKTLQSQIPEAPSNFTAEDLALRETLIGFYSEHNPQNLVNIDAIVARYRGHNLSHLWAQLSLKYGLETHVSVELLSRTLWTSAPFEYFDEALAERLDGEAKELRQAASSEGRSRSDIAVELFKLALDRGVEDGDDSLIRYLCFRGVPDEGHQRALVWQMLLGYLPLARHADWNAIRGHKRALYASYRNDFLARDETGRLVVRQDDEHNVSMSSQELFQEIQNDVSRTRRDTDLFRRSEASDALLAMLFVYAMLNLGVRYVQGMNEVLAVLFFVMSTSNPGKACVDEEIEADTFWCFSEMMAELKEGFMQSMDDSAEGCQAIALGVGQLLKAYDFELARHLQRCDLPPVVWSFRWCTLLFAQDATLPDVVRLWDSFIADPFRYSFVVHVAVAAVLARRDELLSSDKQFVLAETLQGAPREADMGLLMRRAWAVCAFERRQQSPPFPQRSSLQTVEELTELAQTAVARAQEVRDDVARTIQEHIAPAVIERAGHASSAAAAAAHEFQKLIEDTAPQRQQAIANAQTHLASFWDTVKTKGAAALAKGQELAADIKAPDAAGVLPASGHAASAWAAASAALMGRSSAASAPASSGDARAAT